MSRLAGAALGVLADRVLGEPPDSVHPVAAFGRTMQALERWGYSDGRGAGARHAAAGVAVALAAGRLVRSTTVATWSAVAGRSLGESATAIGDALAVGDLERADRKSTRLNSSH